MYKAVIFDLDGTLVNSLEDLAAACNYALEKLGLPIHKTEKYKYFVGDGMQMLVQRILPADKRNGEVYQKCFDLFIAYYREHFCDKTVAYDGIFDLLSELKQRKIKTAVVSNKLHEMTAVVINKLLPDFFSVTYGKQAGIAPKPNPELVNKAFGVLGLSSKECLYVGDSGVDMQTAINSGCTPVGVLWGFRTKEELLQNGALYTVEKPSEILKFF